VRNSEEEEEEEEEEEDDDDDNNNNNKLSFFYHLYAGYLKLHIETKIHVSRICNVHSLYYYYYYYYYSYYTVLSLQPSDASIGLAQDMRTAR